MKNETRTSVEFRGGVGLLALAFYLGAGSVLHLILLGGAIDWSSAWTYAIVLGWPILLFLFSLPLLVLAGGLIWYFILRLD